jgi:hypothetical protein
MILRTQTRVPYRRTGDYGDAQLAGADDDVAVTPASFCRRHMAREHPQATRAASSPSREPPELLHGEEEAATERIDGGGGGLGFEMAAAGVLQLGGKSPREEWRRWLNRPRGGHHGVRAQGRRRGCGAVARPARSDPDLARGCDSVEGMTTGTHTSAGQGEGRRWSGPAGPTGLRSAGPRG